MGGILRGIAAIILLFVILAAPWLFGGAVEIHQAWIAWGIMAALVCALAAHIASRRDAMPSHPSHITMVLIIGLLAIGWGAIQCIPWPKNTLRILSPSAYALWNGVEEPSSTIDTISLYPSSTWTELSRLCLVSGTFLAAMEIFRCPKWKRRTLVLLGINGVVFVIFSWIQGMTWNGKIFWLVPFHQTGQPFGAYVNRNHAGGFLNLSLAAALALAIERLFARHAPTRGSYREQTASRADSGFSFDRTVLVWSCCVVLLAGVFSTQSRGAVVSLLIAGVVTATRLWHSMRGKWLLPIVAAYALLLAAGLSLTWWVGKGEVLQDRMTGLVDDWSAATTGRIDHWADSLKMVPDFWRSGSGLGTYRYLYRMYETTFRPAWYYHAENCYLEVCVEAGIIGFALFVGLWITGFWLTRNATSPHAGVRKENGSEIALAIAGCHALTTQCVHAAFDFNLYMVANAMYVSLVFAILSVQPARESVEADESRRPYEGAVRRFHWQGFCLAALMLGNAIAVGFSARRLQIVGQIAETANRIDQLNLSQPLEPDPLRIEHERLSKSLRKVLSAEGFDRLARLSELVYRCNVFGILKLQLPTADPVSIWQLTNIETLHSRLYRQGSNLEAGLQEIKQDANIQNELRAAWDYFGKSIAICPLRATPYLGRARLAFLFDAPQAEVEQMERALRAAPQDIDLLFDAARLHFQAGRYDEGLKALRKSLIPSAKYVLDAEVLASVFLPKEDVLEKVYRGLPLRAVAVGRRLAEKGRSNVEVTRLADVIEQSMSTATLTEAQKSYLIGATAEFRGDLLAASRAYQHALMLDPMQHEWHFEYALVLVKLQDLGKALDHVRRSVTLNPRAAKYKQLETQLEDKIRERVGR